jgi:hypothetical protein
MKRKPAGILFFKTQILGNYFFLFLPNSRVEIDIPVYFQAPLTAQKDESVIPDVSVERQPEDIGNSFDREIETIKKLIGRTSQTK